MNKTVHDLFGFVPFDINFDASPAVVKWINASELNLSFPFFYQSVEKVNTNQRQTITTSISAVSVLAGKVRDVADHELGFIFHSSRCGSTLVSNLLNSTNSTFVLSEPQPISAICWRILASTQDGNGNQIIEISLFKDLLKIYFSALSHSLKKRRMLIKFVSWATISLPTIQQHFASVPTLFIFRNPIDTIVSLMNSSAPPPMHAINHQYQLASLMADVPLEDVIALEKEEYLARILANYFRIAAKSKDRGTFLSFDYERIKDDLTVLLNWFNIVPHEYNESAFKSVMSSYSKDSRQPFIPDTEQKRNLATPAIVSAALRHSMKSYLHLSGNTSYS